MRRCVSHKRPLTDHLLPTLRAALNRRAKYIKAEPRCHTSHTYGEWGSYCLESYRYSRRRGGLSYNGARLRHLLIMVLSIDFDSTSRFEFAVANAPSKNLINGMERYLKGRFGRRVIAELRCDQRHLSIPQFYMKVGTLNF